MPSWNGRSREAEPLRVRLWLAHRFEQSTRASRSKHNHRGVPGFAATLPWVSAPAHRLHLRSPEEDTMYYGIGGTILIVVVVLFLTGRL